MYALVLLSSQVSTAFDPLVKLIHCDGSGPRIDRGFHPVGSAVTASETQPSRRTALTDDDCRVQMLAQGTDVPGLCSIQYASTRNQSQLALRSSRLDLSEIQREAQSPIEMLFESGEHRILHQAWTLTIWRLDRTGGLRWFDSEWVLHGESGGDRMGWC